MTCFPLSDLILVSNPNRAFAMAPSSSPCVSLPSGSSDGVSLEDDYTELMKEEEKLIAKEREMVLMDLLFKKEYEDEDPLPKLLKMSRSRLAEGILSLFTRLS